MAVVSRAGQDQSCTTSTAARPLRVSLSSGGWAANSDQVYAVRGSTLTTCSTTTGECHDTSVPPVGRNTIVRYAGRPYES